MLLHLYFPTIPAKSQGLYWSHRDYTEAFYKHCSSHSPINKHVRFTQYCFSCLCFCVIPMSNINISNRLNYITFILIDRTRWLPVHNIAQLALCQYILKMLLDAEGIMKKYPLFTKLSTFPQKWAWPCHAPQESQKYFLPFWKYFLGRILLDAEEILKNIYF